MAASAAETVKSGLLRRAAATGEPPGLSARILESSRKIAGSLAEVERRLKLRAEDEPIAPAARSWRDLEPADVSEFAGLATKKAFDANVAAAISESSREQPLSMVFVDVDDLKSLNTKFTNPRVNKGLAGLARILVDVVRGKGKAFKYGGDEFALLLPNTTSEEAHATAERVRRFVEVLSIPDEPDMKLTVSCGVACLEYVPERTSEAFETAAATAERKAKEAGKNRVEVWLRDQIAGQIGLVR